MKNIFHFKKYTNTQKYKKNKIIISKSSNNYEELELYWLIECISNAVLHYLTTADPIDVVNNESTFLRSCTTLSTYGNNFLSKSENELNSTYCKSLKTMEELCILLKKTLNNETYGNKTVQSQLSPLQLLQSKNNNAEDYLKTYGINSYNERQNQFKNIILEELSLLKEEFKELKRQNLDIIYPNIKAIFSKSQSITNINGISNMVSTQKNEECKSNIIEKAEITEDNELERNFENVKTKSFQSNLCHSSTCDFDTDFEEIPTRIYKESKLQDIVLSNNENKGVMLTEDRSFEVEDKNIDSMNYSSRTYKKNFVQSLIKDLNGHFRKIDYEYIDPLPEIKLLQPEFKGTCDIIGLNERFSTNNRKPCLPLNPSDIELGNIVKFTRNGTRICIGIAQYVGMLPNQNEIFVGLELERNDGIHDGTYCGKRYFKCIERQGIFVSFQRIIMIYK